MTLREELILQMLHGGQYDGPVGEPFCDERGHLIEHRIEHGIPCTYERKPSLILAVLTGKQAYGNEAKIKEYRTDTDKLKFLREYGSKMKEVNVRGYSIGASPTKPKCSSAKSESTSKSSKFRNKKGKCSYPKIEEELILLERLKSRELDGRVGDTYHDNGYGSSLCFEINHGVPVQVQLGPGGKFFNNEENEHWSSEPKIVHRYLSDDEKILFLRRYGWLMNDSAVKDYSAKYKDKAKQK